MFSLLCQLVALVVSHFGFKDGTLVLIASVPGYCLPFTLNAVDEIFLSDRPFI